MLGHEIARLLDGHEALLGVQLLCVVLFLIESIKDFRTQVTLT